MTFEVKLKAQFQPKRAAELSAVVDAYRNTPVKIVEAASVPLRPKLGNSTKNPPRSAPGTPTTAMISEFRYVRLGRNVSHCRLEQGTEEHQG